MPKREKLLRTKTKPTQYYRYPLAPRKTPRQAPTVGIFDEPYVCTRINQEWLSHILGVLTVLTEEDAWDGSESEKYRAQQEIEKLLNSLKDNSHCDPCEFEHDCMDIPLNDPRIEWLPRNPFTHPNDVPVGYLFPPWYIAPGLNLLGLFEGDVATDIVRITGIVGWNNLPRFRLTLTGPGIVYIHFTNVFQGGLAQIQVDGTLESLRYVELKRDDLSLPGESNEIVIIEREIPEGEHFIDVTAFPVVNDELVPSSFGLGIHRIVLCNFGQFTCPDCPDCPEPPPCPDCPPVEDCGCCDDDEPASDCGCCDDDDVPAPEDCGCDDNDVPAPEDCGCCDDEIDEPEDCGCE